MEERSRSPKVTTVTVPYSHLEARFSATDLAVGPLPALCMAVPRTKPSVVFSTSLRVAPVVLDWKVGQRWRWIQRLMKMMTLKSVDDG